MTMSSLSMPNLSVPLIAPPHHQHLPAMQALCVCSSKLTLDWNDEGRKDRVKMRAELDFPTMRHRRRLGRFRDRLDEFFFRQDVDQPRLIRRCAIAALLLITIVYADVIFLGASVSAVNFLNITV